MIALRDTSRWLPINAATVGTTYRPDIDGMRAIAVLAVMAFHAGFWTLGGFAGVDIFFVLSGFVITRVLDDSLKRDGRIDFWKFYERRARRLLPPLLVVLGATLAVACIVGISAEDRQSIFSSAAAALVFGANVYFDSVTSNYFAQSSDLLPLLHLWSLGVEEQFYLVWPWFLVLLLRLPAKARVLTVIGVIVASFVCAEVMLYLSPRAAFFEMPARCWELAAGGLVSLMPRVALPLRGSILNIALFLLVSFLFVPWPHVPGWGMLPVTAVTALLLWDGAGNGAQSWATRLLSTRPLVAVGRISYSMYLWHWPLLAFARISRAGPLPAWTAILLCLATLALAWLSGRFIEGSVRGARSTSAPKFVVANVVACVSCAFLCLSIVGVIADKPWLDSANDERGRMAENDIPTTARNCHYSWNRPLAKDIPISCISDPKLPQKLVLWGDSHALAMQPFAWALASSKGYAAVEFTRDSCRPILNVSSDGSAIADARCREFNDYAFRYAQKADVVILSAMWKSGEVDADYSRKLRLTLDGLAGVPQVLLMGPTPVLPASVPQCLRLAELDACQVRREAFQSESSKVVVLLRQIAASHPNVKYIDLADFFCGASVCPGYFHGTALYWDNHHISRTAALELAARYIAQEGTSPHW